MSAHDAAFSGYRPRLDDFRSAGAALARAYVDDVPTYAPTLFATALDLWNRAQHDAARHADTRQVHRLLAEVEEKLEQAAARAAANREVLSDLVRLRSERIRNTEERFYAADLLSSAEEQYRLAVAVAETDDMDLAVQHAVEARDLFHSATLRYLERGLVDHFEQALGDPSLSQSAGHGQDIRSELTELREAIVRAREGVSSVVALTRRTAALSQQVEDLLAPSPVGGGGDGVLAPPDAGWAPGTFGPPEAPLAIGIGARSANSLTVNWLNRAGGRTNFLMRQQAGGPWEVAAEFGGLAGWTTYTDGGLQPDTRYCYRVRSEGAHGASWTPLDNRACGHTRGVPTILVWRLQLRVRTANVSNADSDNALQVRLNANRFNYKPNASSTWMDYGPRVDPSLPYGSARSDDFERGRDFTYDLKVDLQQLTDITMLTLHKEGTDALGIAEIELRVNGVTVFEKLFGETASTCLWLDNGDGYWPTYTIDYPELRAHGSWQAFVNSSHLPPLEISNAEMVSRIEGIIGDQLHGTPAYWGHLYGSTWVEARRLDDHALRVDVDLSAAVPGLNPEIDLDFDLRFDVLCDTQSGTATFSMTTENFDSSVDFDLLEEILTFGAINLVEDDIALGIEQAIQPIVQLIVVQTGGLCPTVEINADGDVHFELPA